MMSLLPTPLLDERRTLLAMDAFFLTEAAAGWGDDRQFCCWLERLNRSTRRLAFGWLRAFSVPDRCLVLLLDHLRSIAFQRECWGIGVRR